MTQDFMLAEGERSGKDEDFERFLAALSDAGRRMHPHYFQVEMAELEGPVFRERVYCYELYHQLRLALCDGFSPIGYPGESYRLDGEVDKSGHPRFKEALAKKKPDLIVHVSGEMERNLAVMEVKPVTVVKCIGRLVDDLTTLQLFLQHTDYHRAIMLIYGDEHRDSAGRILKKVHERVEPQLRDKFLLVWHASPTDSPVPLTWEYIIRKYEER